jgi:hypothetical protein
VTLQQQLLGVLQTARGIAPALGLHRVTVSVRTRTWSGHVQTGTSAVSTVVLGAPDPISGAMLPPHVAGTSGDPEVTVGPLTPFDPVTAPRGFTVAQLNPGPAPNVESYWLLTFPDGVSRQYQVVPRGIDTTRPLHYTVKLKALDRKLPF